MKRIWRRLLVLLVIFVVAATSLWGYIQRATLIDTIELRGYKPTTQIAALAADTTMTSTGKRLFYVNHPALEDKQAFNRHCMVAGMESAVLGCYHGNRQGIYLYAVTDTRLAGVEQVTAAHEMLHQAYDRLNSSERAHIDNLLENYYKNGLKDPDIIDKINAYKGQNNAVLVDEMHSIFGSEVRDLPKELKDYYARYFSDREKVVSYSESYRAEFTRRKNLVAQYDTQLATLKVKIDANKADLDSRTKQLDELSSTITQDAATHDQAAYRTDVAEYNTLVDVYNKKLATTKELINNYNTIVAQRNDIAVQERDLQTALSSRPVTAH